MEFQMSFTASAARALTKENSRKNVEEKIKQITSEILRACNKGYYSCVLEKIVVPDRCVDILRNAGYVVTYNAETAPWATLSWDDIVPKDQSYVTTLYQNMLYEELFRAPDKACV